MQRSLTQCFCITQVLGKVATMIAVNSYQYLCEWHHCLCTWAIKANMGLNCKCSCYFSPYIQPVAKSCSFQLQKIFQNCPFLFVFSARALTRASPSLEGGSLILPNGALAMPLPPALPDPTPRTSQLSCCWMSASNSRFPSCSCHHAPLRPWRAQDPLRSRAPLPSSERMSFLLPLSDLLSTGSYWRIFLSFTKLGGVFLFSSNTGYWQKEAAKWLRDLLAFGI